MSIANNFQGEAIIKKITAQSDNSCQNGDESKGEVQNAFLYPSSFNSNDYDNLGKVNVSDFFVNEFHKENFAEKALSPLPTEKIKALLLMGKKAQRLLLINVAVLLVIIISYLYLIVYNFFGDVYNLINIIQNGIHTFFYIK